jgi:hypothetical protein
VLLAH